MIERKIKMAFAVISAALFFIFVSQMIFEFTPICTETECIYPDALELFLEHGWIFALSIASTLAFLFFLKQQRHKEFNEKWNS